MRKLTAATLNLTYDKDSLSPSFSFFGIYLFLGFREFPIRKRNDTTLLSASTFTTINTFTPIGELDLFRDLLDREGIDQLKSDNFYIDEDQTTKNQFRLGSIYLTDKFIFKDNGLDIQAGIKLKDIVLSLTFVSTTNSADSVTLSYKPTVNREYTFSYLNGERVYLTPET
jgi:hypothetical protein